MQRIKECLIDTCRIFENMFEVQLKVNESNKYIYAKHLDIHIYMYNS